MSQELEKELNNSIEIIKNQGVIVYPTDTIWGLGCDATDEAAVKKVFEIKGRQEDKSVIVLVSDDRMLLRYVKEVPEMAWELMKYSERPMTIIYPEGKNLANGVIAQDGTIAIRVVKDEFCQKLIQKLGKPLVSTSANKSGEPSPKSFRHISPTILDAVDYVVNLRQNETGSASPSSIVQLGMKGEVKIIRK